MRYAREDWLHEDDYIAVIGETIMRSRRPLTNKARIRAMLDGANFIMTARDDAGQLVGLMRCITDNAWICYCAELAVRESHQGKGVGRDLLKAAKATLGPMIALNLMADAEAVPFYEHIGMEQLIGFLMPRTDRS